MHGSEGRTLVIDVGGTKFTIAVFEGDRILLRETRRTDRRGGPAALVATLKNVWNAWNARERLIVGRVGIGFGGPVDFPTQTVTLSTHVSGWNEYPLVAN